MTWRKKERIFSALSDTPRVDVVDGTNYWTRSHDDNFSCPCLALPLSPDSTTSTTDRATSVVSKSECMNEFSKEEGKERKADPHLKFDQHHQSVLANVFTSTNRLIKNHEFAPNFLPFVESSSCEWMRNICTRHALSLALRSSFQPVHHRFFINIRYELWKTRHVTHSARENVACNIQATCRVLVCEAELNCKANHVRTQNVHDSHVSERVREAPKKRW